MKKLILHLMVICACGVAFPGVASTEAPTPQRELEAGFQAKTGDDPPTRKEGAAAKAAVSINGSIKNNFGAPLCALVLANGQFVFSCSPTGTYSLDIPLDAAGQFTLFGFADGHFPYKGVFNGVGGRYDITLNVANTGSVFAAKSALGGLKATVSISGSIRNNLGAPLCALVLANGQFAFSCSPTGTYALDIPLDAAGQFTLFAFADGHFPYKAVFNGVGGRYDITVTVARAASTLAIATLPLPDATAGSPYVPQQAATATGGTPPYHYQLDTLANGAPPLGMGIDLNGNLTGTPSASYTTTRTFTFGVCVVDIVATIKCAQTSVTVRPPAPVASGSITWTLGDQCNNGYRIDYRFFDPANNMQWPTDRTLVYFMSNGQSFRSTMNCVPGGQVCFGASSNSGALTWGVGLSGTGSCTSCCGRCDGSSYSATLTCPGVDGGSTSYYANWSCGSSSQCASVMGGSAGTRGPFCTVADCQRWGNQFIPTGYSCATTATYSPVPGGSSCRSYP